MARLSSLFSSILSLSLGAAALSIGPIAARSAGSSFNVDQFLPPLNYVPHKTGIPFIIKNETAQPWVHLSTHAASPPNTTSSRANTTSHGKLQTRSCSGPTPDNPTTFWYESIVHGGESSFMDSTYKANYNVFRNVVTDFGADNTGATDASAAIQSAINAGASNAPYNRTDNAMGTTGQPAMVYIPAGTYLLNKSLQLYVGTVIIGDALNPPTFKASSSFSGDHIIYGKDPNQGGTVNFYIGIKNIIIDSTSVPTSQSVTLLDWTVSQGTQLANVVFNMPDYSQHVGLTTQYDYNSNTILNDLTFYGGSVALQLSGQQWILKSIAIDGANTGIVAGAFDLVCLHCSFSNGAVGIDASGVSGSLTVIDSAAINLGTLISSSNPGGSAGNSIILENIEMIQPTATTVTLNGNVALTGSVTDTWVHGNAFTWGSTGPQNQYGETLSTPRPSGLLNANGDYFTIAPPTYSQYSSSQFVNIKYVNGLPVYGDGVTDDTANINAILAQFAGCSIIYFPAGTYIVTNTVFVPKGSIIVGDAYASAISAVGSQFWNPDAPVAMVQVGNPGDVGVAQISDMMFTVADVLQGCKLVEVNIAGESPGAVGFWNSHFRIGGAAGSKVETNCNTTPDACKAAWGLLHLTSTSSVYIENMWGWTADHDLDGGNFQTISTGRGMLVEATQGTWLVGTAMEHHTLYQYNFHSAQNVFSGFQQSETAYWQGSNGVDFAPAPWSSNLISSDPTFSNCATTDGGCRMGWFEMIQLSSNIFLYGGCVWTFYNANQPCQGDCQQNAVYVEASTSLYLYGTNVKTITNIIYQDGVDYATEIGNGGGWGGVVAVYQDLYGVPNGNAVSGAGFSWYDPTFTDGNAGYADPQYYYCFNGPASNFPPFKNWMNFYDMFDLNQKTSMASEEQGPIQGDIYNAIVELSQASLVDARLILAIVMQESTGSVYVGCTNNGVRNCGLMQSYNGVSFDPNAPQASILQMIIDGIQGTYLGPGIVQWFNDAEYVGYNTGGNPYEVTRGYNSGSIDYNDLSDPQGATASYVSDIANRLQGWNGLDGEGYRAACGWPS